MHNIVILGANFAGTSTAHYLLRHVLPRLDDLDVSSKNHYRITLISPSDHTFWKSMCLISFQPACHGIAFHERRTCLEEIK